MVGSVRDSTPHLRLYQLLPAVAGVYVTQAIITVLITQALPTLLRSEGASLALVGLTALLWVPWGIRFLWGSYIERWRLPVGTTVRRSRQIVLGGQWTMGAMLIGIGWLSHRMQGTLVTQVGWVLTVLLLTALVAATADIACDGFVVDQLSERQRGWGNTIQVGGAYIGAMMGSGGFLLVSKWWGWEQAFLLTGLLVWSLTIPLFLIHEPPRGPRAVKNHRPTLGYALRRPEMQVGLLLLLVSSVGIRLSLAMFGPLLLDRGLSLNDVGWLFGALYIGAGLGGAVLGGVVVRFLPGWRSVWVAVAAKAIGLTLLALAASTLSVWGLMVLIVVIFVVMGVLWVALYSMLMGLTSPLQAGLDFTLFQSADALLAGVAGVTGGWVSQHIGYSFCFGLAAGLTWIGAGWVWRYDRLVSTSNSPTVAQD